MEWLRAYFQRERKKLRMLRGRAKAAYLWQYYKLWITGILSAAALIVYVVVHRLTVPLDNWFYITFANTYAEAGERSPVWRDFVAFSGYDVREKNVYFNDNCYFDPASEGYNAYYTYFVAYVEAGTLDLIAMEREDLETLGRKGWLLDLSRPEAAPLAEKYADRLIYALPLDETYSALPVPVGIDLSGTRLVEEYHLYADTCAVGLSANCPHPEAVEKFLDFAMEEGDP